MGNTANATSKDCCATDTVYHAVLLGRAPSKRPRERKQDQEEEYKDPSDKGDGGISKTRGANPTQIKVSSFDLEGRITLGRIPGGEGGRCVSSVTPGHS